MIKKILLGTAALAALSTTAFAADLPSRAAPPVFVAPIPVFSWTGFYIGGQAGYAFGEDRVTVTVPRLGSASGTIHPKGAIGGAHVGYNFAGLPGIGGGLGLGGLVFGVEADIDGTDYRDVATAGGASTTLSSHVQGSARGRVGFAVDRALFFATGGAAFTQFQTNYFAGGVNLPGLAKTRVGYAVGGGMEYAITTQWSLRAQYIYSDFGTYSETVGGIDVRRKETMQKAQIGFSYKFDTPAPVVARY